MMSAPELQGPWYRLADLAQLFDVNERTIWKWVSQGKLPQPRRNGKRWSRWVKTEVDEALKSFGRLPAQEAAHAER